MSHSSSDVKPTSQTRRNLGVFVVLAVLTAAELGLAASGASGLRTGVFLTLSLAKATLVALFFMHLKDNSKVYGLTFLAPVLLVLVMSLLVVAA